MSKNVKFALICGITVFIIALLVLYAYAKPAPPDTRPGDAALQDLGECDAITAGGSVEIYCEDGSHWKVTLDPLPSQ